MDPLGQSDDVAAAYDRWATSYDTDRNATRDLDAEVLRQSGLNVDDRDVIELGCGTGKNTVWLASKARRVTALDFSAGMLARAAATVEASSPKARVEFVQHDVRERWPVDSASVDVVIGNLVLEHVENLEPVFAEVARVLRRGGSLYFCELHPARQSHGSQAQFTDEATGARVRVAAYSHSVADYLAGARASQLDIVRVADWTEPGAAPDALPRLLSIEARAV